MTKQEYVLLANVCCKMRPVRTDPHLMQTSAAYVQWYAFVYELSLALVKTNASFSRVKFLDACGVNVLDRPELLGRLTRPETEGV